MAVLGKMWAHFNRKKKKSFFPDVIKNMILNKEYIEPGSLPKINFRNRTHDVPFLEDPIIY